MTGLIFCNRLLAILSGQYNQFLLDKQKLIERVDGIVKFQDLLLAVLLEVRMNNITRTNAF